MDTLRVGVGCPGIEEVEDVGAPALDGPAPLDHRGIIGEKGNLDQVFKPYLSRLLGPESVELPELFLHPVELFERGEEL